MGIHTDTHTHTHTHPLRNIQAHRHKEGRHDHTLKHRYTKAQAHSYAGQEADSPVMSMADKLPEESGDRPFSSEAPA